MQRAIPTTITTMPDESVPVRAVAQSSNLGRAKSFAVARTPDVNSYTGYEAAKQAWIDAHPDATPEQYAAAMTQLARLFGV